MNLGNIIGTQNDGHVKVYAQETKTGTSSNIIEPTEVYVPVTAYIDATYPALDLGTPTFL